MSNRQYKELLDNNSPAGIVIAVDQFLLRARGLSPAPRGGLVLLEDGSKAIIWEITDDDVVLLHLGDTPPHTGIGAVLQNSELVTRVGNEYLGRIISVTGEPLDGKGPIASEGAWRVFNDAPPLIERRELETQVPTGVTVADILFPLARGQRMAILGESKSGKSAFLTQIAAAQKDSDMLMVFALIAKRRSDIDELVRRLNDSGVMDRCVIVVSTVFDSLVTSYLVPYVACSMAEYFWQNQNRDTIIAYDDLTAHAQVYREISLLAGISPGRDSYPGDMFYAHSSLLERAGRLGSTGASLTSLPVVLVNNGDITAYLPTNIMSISDGQYIFDLKLFRQDIRPALNTGLSVSRVGGRSHNARQKDIAGRVFKKLAAHREAAEYAHFGSELALEAKADLEQGKLLLDLMKQGPLENYTLTAQQLMLDIVLSVDTSVAAVDVEKMKKLANEYATQVTDDASYEKARKELADASIIEVQRSAKDNTAQTAQQQEVQAQ